MLQFQNRGISIVIIFLLFFSCFATAQADTKTEPIKIVFSTFWPVSYEYLWIPITHFAEKIEKESNQRVKFKLYHSKQLFGGKEELAALERGDVDMICPTDLYHTELIPELGITSLPFLYKDAESFQKILEAGLFDLGINQKFLEHNIVALSAWGGDPFQIYSLEFPVISPEDMKGKKWAVAGPIHSKAIEILGGIPDFLSSSQLYMAFQKGMINGGTRPLITGYGRKLYEVVDYLTITNFAFFTSVLCINKSKWESLPKDIQDIILEADKERIKENSRMVKDFIDNTIKTFEEQGIKVHISSQKEKEAFKKAMAPVYDWWLKQVPDGQKYIDFVNQYQ
ncbi:MAG: TRAP transporter substrate-binding protein DctP [Pseudomonadota bacterium]